MEREKLASCESCIHGMYFMDFQDREPIAFWECLAPAMLPVLVKILSDPILRAENCGMYVKKEGD